MANAMKPRGRSRSLGSAQSDIEISEMEAQSLKIREIMKWSQDDLGKVIAYFRMRVETEEAYLRGLERLVTLHDNQEFVSYPFQDRTNDTTFQTVWTHLLATTAEMARGRKDLLQILRREYESLASTQSRHERVRKEVKANMKRVNDEYAEMRTQMLPRYRKAYEMKCKELDVAAASIEKVHSGTSATGGASASTAESRHTSEAMDRTSLDSNEDQQGLNREKRIDRFINKVTSLAQGEGSVTRQNVKNAKTKKEVMDADLEYRKYVVALETLRLRQQQITDHSYLTLESHLTEKLVTTKSAYEACIAAERKSNDINSNALDLFADWTACLKPEVDIELIRTDFKKEEFVRPATIYYWNYHAGESKDMLFGISLMDYARTHKRHVPLLVTKCISAIESLGGIQREGIYRLSGRQTTTERLKQQFERDEEAIVLGPSEQGGITDDIFAIAVILKIYLRELPEPILPMTMEERIRYSEVDDEKRRVIYLKEKIQKLPDSHIHTLRAVIEHLAKVVKFQDQNKMNIQNLSLVFTPALFHDHNDAATPGLWSNDKVLEDLIFYHRQLFFDSRDTHEEPFLSEQPPLDRSRSPMQSALQDPSFRPMASSRPLESLPRPISDPIQASTPPLDMTGSSQALGHTAHVTAAAPTSTLIDEPKVLSLPPAQVLAPDTGPAQGYEATLSQPQPYQPVLASPIPHPLPVTPAQRVGQVPPPTYNLNSEIIEKSSPSLENQPFHEEEVQGTKD